MTPPEPRPANDARPGPGSAAAETAWRTHRDEVARRNEATKKRAAAERKSRDAIAGARLRADADLEAEQLRELNARIDRRRRGPA